MHFPFRYEAYKWGIKNRCLKINEMLQLSFNADDEFFKIMRMRFVFRCFSFFASATSTENILKISVIGTKIS
mgnify:CR=1 FL=1